MAEFTKGVKHKSNVELKSLKRRTTLDKRGGTAPNIKERVETNQKRCRRTTKKWRMII